MIATRSGMRNRGYANESSSEGTRSLRANIPLQNMAIKITTEVDHDADSTNQRGIENSSPDMKSAVLDAREHVGIPTDLRYPAKMSLGDSMA